MPEGLVRELAYTGRRMPAAEAKAVGLVNQTFPDQAMLDGVMAIAAEGKSALAVYGCKRMINYSKDHSTADTLDYSSDLECIDAAGSGNARGHSARFICC